MPSSEIYFYSNPRVPSLLSQAKTENEIVKYENLYKVKIRTKSLNRKQDLTLVVMGYFPNVDHVTGNTILVCRFC